MRLLPRLLIPAAAALALAAAAAPASASSIAYISEGDVWLSSPDGSKRYRVTHDGGYLSPSQADDGTIVAWRAKRFVRMDRGGRMLNPPVDGIGTDDGGGQFVGPFDPKVSPDGRRIAYWFGQYTSRYSYACYCYLYTVESRSAWTWADSFKPYSEDAFATGIEQPSWLGNDRIFATFPSFYMSAWTWKLDSGHPSQDAQWSFSLRDPDGSYRLDLSDGEVSPDGSKVAVTAGGDALTQDQLWLFTTNGPLWAGEPPYDNISHSGPLPAQPDARCAGTVGKLVSPTWSPGADALAFSLESGVYVMPVGDIAASCDGLSGALIAPGGSQPDWGPAPVDVRQAPAPGSAPGPAKPAAPPVRETALTLSDVSITRRFKAARPGARRAGGKLRFTVSEPARVTLKVKRRGRPVGRIETAGKPGVNRQRVTGRFGRRTLAPGRYKLALAATDLTGREHAHAAVKFEIRR